MPVDFLTDAQKAQYGQYAGEPTEGQLARYFYLDDTEHALVRQHRGEHNRLGFVLQLCTVRFLGTFLSNPTDVPPGVITYLATQLQISDTACLGRYRDGKLHWEHASEIKQHYGYQDFHAQPEHFFLVRWLYTRAWLSAERPSVLFDLTTHRLIERKILLPGVSTLIRLIARIRERTDTRFWRILAQAPSTAQQACLEQLLIVPTGERVSPLDRLRRAPTRLSAPAMVKALQRLAEIRDLGVNGLNLQGVPAGRLQALARYAAAARAQAIARMPIERRTATLVAFALVFEATAQDDALDLLDQLLTLFLAKAERKGERGRIRTLKELDTAALYLSQACTFILDEANYADAAVRTAIFASLDKLDLANAVKTVNSLARPPHDTYYDHLVNRYSQVRQFLPLLLKTVNFNGTKAAAPVLDALHFLHRIEGQRRPPMTDAPTEVITQAWRRVVIDADGKIKRPFYTFCTLERLQDGLWRRDIYVAPSERWGNLSTKLLQGDEWAAVRIQVCRSLGRSLNAPDELASLSQRLDAAYYRTVENFPLNTAVQLDPQTKGVALTVTNLDKLEEPESLIALRQRVNDLLPAIDLPDAVLEIHGYTGFADEFTHINQGNARVTDLALSICAVLIAEATNIGLEPLVRSDVPALTRGRLAWVQQNYVRAETLRRANARLVAAQTHLPLAQAWGGGEVASADGLRFVVPIRTLNAGPNSKYFHVERGVTYYNFASDQYTGLHGIVIPGTMHEGPFLLEGLLEQETSLHPTEFMTDTAAYSDMIFGLFHLLGYQFSPRLADVGEARFWRLDPQADYGVLNALARHRLNATLITQNWDDMLRIAGSLKMGTVRASELVRSLQRRGRTSSLAQGIAELGRIAKTLYLLAYIDDETYRRRILTQLNRSEGRHRIARALFHGQRGELRQRYREGQEDQLGALGLMVNILVLWNTRYIDAALNHLRAEGVEVKAEDAARLSPLADSHIHYLGRYRFPTDEALLRGEMRSLNPSPALDFW